MKRKSLKQTKADALQKLGTLKTKVKDNLKTKNNNVTFLPSIYKLLISLKIYTVKTLWLDKIFSTVVATFVNLLRATFSIIIKANLILAVIVYITQMLGVENTLTSELYIYLGLFLYYTFKDTLLDYTGNLYDFIKNCVLKLISNLHEVKVNEEKLTQ